MIYMLKLFKNIHLLKDSENLRHLFGILAYSAGSWKGSWDQIDHPQDFVLEIKSYPKFLIH